MKNRKALKIILLTVGLLSIAALFSYILSKKALSISKFTLQSGKTASAIRIVQLSDLHNAEFGKNNARLITCVAAQQPQLILITGDLVDRDDSSTEQAEALIRELCDLAPVYISLGNHELEHEARYGTDLRSSFTAAGGVVLEREWIDIEIDGQQLRLGGIYSYCVPRKYIKGSKDWEEEAAFVESFDDAERLKLLMCHMPYTWLVLDGFDEWDIDFVFCGHIHGGQVKLPFVGGLWAPDQGWFPGKVAGLYLSEDGNRAMLLSRGLGNSGHLPRFNNIPEITVLDIIPSDGKK